MHASDLRYISGPSERKATGGDGPKITEKEERAIDDDGRSANEGAGNCSLAPLMGLATHALGREIVCMPHSLTCHLFAFEPTQPRHPRLIARAAKTARKTARKTTRKAARKTARKPLTPSLKKFP